MLLIDYTQIAIANIMVNIPKGETEIDIDIVRHTVLNQLRSFIQKFQKEYGEVVICCDDRNYWRKKIFPYYKVHRKKAQDESLLNWNQIFGCINTVKEELKQYFPYKVVQAESAEADDCIGTICHEFGHLGIAPQGCEKILIISTDKDFQQLQKYANVEQYNPVTKSFLRVVNPDRYRREHIMKGDKGDGIPNFLSDEDSFVTGKRQKSLMTAKLNVWALQEPNEFCDEAMLKRYNRNRILVDLDCIPPSIRRKVMESYNTPRDKKGTLLEYFVKFRLRNLFDKIQEFHV